jgi:hypothetical protein
VDFGGAERVYTYLGRQKNNSHEGLVCLFWVLGFYYESVSDIRSAWRGKNERPLYGSQRLCRRRARNSQHDLIIESFRKRTLMELALFWWYSESSCGEIIGNQEKSRETISSYSIWFWEFLAHSWRVEGWKWK